ncbi:hypothetical protein RHMOL_Rhmol04G0348600 [Rhododendron molle]|uniref:Uncharacterized protein n=1 Tax=Rhododendron molle TaxID=49168 RepID=A0ACC0P8Q0_RHOML|nr:hypothetical protein RHMOL_Rhmol04G0348600 [Rhododendron molle]
MAFVARSSMSMTSISCSLKQNQGPTRISGLNSVSLSSNGKCFPSLRSRSVPHRFQISCAAKPETVDQVCDIVRKQLALPAETAVTGDSKFTALGADSLDTTRNLHQATDTNHRQFDIKPDKSAKFRNPKTLREDAVETNLDPDGEMAESGPTVATSSGFGGLWFDGMVGMRDPVGEGNSPPGEGKRGVMSGDNSVYGEDTGGPGNTAGAAEIEEALEGVSKFSSEVEEREDVAMKATAIKRYELRFLVGAGAMWTEIIGHQWENTAEDSFLARDVFRDKSAHGCMTMQGGQLRAEVTL